VRGSIFPLERPARLAILASGRGSNLQALIESFGPGDVQGRVKLVVSDRERAPALERARLSGIDAYYVPWVSRDSFEEELIRLLRRFEVDLICLAGFMRLLSPAFVSEYAGQIVNVHPSLLPRFPGLHPHRKALEAGAGESGCTVHFVDAGVDSGPVILQRRVPVLPDDDEETLATRILEQEHLAYPQAVRIVLAGQAPYTATEEEE
jgi:phosphoribosylglycinamide formyltransferase-1